MKRYDLQVGRIKHDCGESFVANMVEVADGRYAEHDEANARIAELTAEVASLKSALRPFVKHYEPWMEEYDPDTKSSSFSRHTFAELIAARNALKEGV